MSYLCGVCNCEPCECNDRGRYSEADKRKRDDTIEHELLLGHWQRVTLRRLLRQQLKRDLKRVETNDRRGWQPAEGCLDLTRLEIDHINAMLEGLGYSADAVYLKGTQ